MATSSHTTRFTQEPVAAARALVPLLAEHAAAGERERTLARPVVDAMADAGLFQLCVPHSAGGVEASPAVLVEVVETLAAGDGAAAWVIAVNATTGLLAGYTTPDTARAIFSGPRAIAGGVFAPQGRARPVAGGYEVSGRWAFASGCRHCDWILGGAIVQSDGEPPAMRLMLARADETIVHDTWRVMGMRGTGSHDVEWRGVFVPEARAVDVSAGPAQAGPLYAFPMFGLLAIAIAGVGLGLGRAALDELISVAGDRTPSGSSRSLAQRAVVQHDVAQAEAALRGARALLRESIADAWASAQADGAISVDQRAALRLAATHATAVGAQVAASAFRLAGGAALYEGAPLERIFRDAQVAPQHRMVAPSTWELTGRLLLGLPTDTAGL